MTEWTCASLFSGIGGFELGLAAAGVRTVASVEIDEKARGVLAHRLPHVKLFDDVQEVSADDLLRAGFNPERGILTAGFPCQDVSLAGKRAGLAGARTGLFFEIIRIAKDLQPRWFLLENVPGLLTSNGGRDMGTVVGALGDLGYGVGWRVLDAQYFGVPQRRRRVFLAGCLGDIARAGEVLLEPESGERDLAPRRAPRTQAAGAAADGAGVPRGPGLLADERGIYTQTVSTLQAGGGARGWRMDAEGAAGGQLIPVPEDVAHTTRYQKGVNTTFDDAAQVVTFQRVTRSGPRDAEGSLPPDRWEERDVASTRNRFDVGGERTNELVLEPVSFRKSKRARASDDDETWVQEEHSNTLNCFDVGETRATQLVAYAFQPTDLAKVTDGGLGVVSPTGEISHTLTSEGFDASEDGTGRGWPTVAFALRGREEGIRPEVSGDGQTVGTLRAASGGSSKDYLAGEWGVRRLTPRECERLQGFPDDHTLERWDFKKEKVVVQSDSARGHQIGNAVAVPVIEWIARGIVENDQ